MSDVIINLTNGMPDACEYCAKTHEEGGHTIDLRPYGKGGAWICFDCGMKPDNKETTEKTFGDILSGTNVVITGMDSKENRKSN